MKIALLPLDERPVNTTLPHNVAAIASAQVVIAPPELLPSFRSAGDADALVTWLSDASRAVDASVVSIDMLAYGGLIPSRTSQDDIGTVLGRIARLRQMRDESPGKVLLGVSLFMRASDSYSAEEEPSYWSTIGREIHAFGADLHRRFKGEEARDERSRLVGHEAELLDFETRRIRNHIVNLQCLSYAADDVFDLLLLTSDDTATYSAGSAEVEWLEHWRRALPGAEDRTLLHPGADEVGSILVSRAVTSHAQRAPLVRIIGDDAQGMGIVPAYENRPVSEAARSQVEASGGVVVDDTEADVWLVIHTPHPERQDWYGQSGDNDPASARRTAELVVEGLRAGALVALADIRHSNGGDPALVEALIEAGVLTELASYGGWNTAGNALGSAVAAGVVASIGTSTNTYDDEARQRLLAHRLLEDVGYQSLIRSRFLRETPQLYDRDFFAAQEQQMQVRVQEELNGLLPGWGLNHWVVENVRFPWHRAFEVDFDLRGRG